jgi:hypothetical protein
MITKINEEVINNNLYFYHSTKNLDAALYIVEKKWKTTLGLYGNGIYGQQYANPLESRNNLSSHSIERYKSLYGNSYRFKIKYNNPENIFYLDLDAGKEVYHNYDINMAINILKNHNVPDSLISEIKPYFSTRNNIPPISQSVFATNTQEGGLLGKYGFKGLVYQGNQDGSCVLFWYPNNNNLEVVEYSTDFGNNWIKYNSSNTSQVNALKHDIKRKIEELNPVLSNRTDVLKSTGKIPSLKIKGTDRDWIRVIECGDKAGYDFKNGDFTSGDLNKFASLVQRQINASKEPKRSRRYNYAIQLLSDVENLINV